MRISRTVVKLLWIVSVILVATMLVFSVIFYQKNKWAAYEQAFVTQRSIAPQQKPRPVGVLITNLGLQNATTELALTLPPTVTMGFSPYGEFTQQWIRAASGVFDIAMHIPTAIPDHEGYAGGLALHAHMLPEVLTAQLDVILWKGRGARIAWMNGASDVMQSEAMGSLVLEYLDQRSINVLIVPPIPAWVKTTMWQHSLVPLIWVDENLSSIAINAAIDHALASHTGPFVMAIRPYPLSIHTLQEWLNTHSDTAFPLVPSSCLFNPVPARCHEKHTIPSS